MTAVEGERSGEGEDVWSAEEEGGGVIQGRDGERERGEKEGRLTDLVQLLLKLFTTSLEFLQV